MSTDANVFTERWDREYEGVRVATVGERAGTDLLGASVWEIQPGHRQGPLHRHHNNEELLIVLAGRPTLLSEGPPRELAAGEVVAFPMGRPGTHALRNDSAEVARVVMISTMRVPEVVEYPERGEIFLMTTLPYRERTPEIEEQGCVVRGFRLADGRPYPPDAEAS